MVDVLEKQNNQILQSRRESIHQLTPPPITDELEGQQDIGVGIIDLTRRAQNKDSMRKQRDEDRKQKKEKERKRREEEESKRIRALDEIAKEYELRKRLEEQKLIDERRRKEELREIAKAAATAAVAVVTADKDRIREKGINKNEDAVKKYQKNVDIKHSHEGNKHKSHHGSGYSGDENEKVSDRQSKKHSGSRGLRHQNNEKKSEKRENRRPGSGKRDDAYIMGDDDIRGRSANKER
ncbi:MAG: hypothetical protein EZS28_044335, partial [Streblomastix strix]